MSKAMSVCLLQVTVIVILCHKARCTPWLLKNHTHTRTTIILLYIYTINSAGFCGGGQGLSWAVEPRKEEHSILMFTPCNKSICTHTNTAYIRTECFIIFWVTRTLNKSRSIRLPIKSHIRGCIKKFPDWVDNEIYAYNNKHSLRSNT
jgi:hypothetical protein